MKETGQTETDAMRNLSELVDLMPQQVWTADSQGKLTYVNEKVLEYGGITEDVATGTGWYDLIHPDDLPATIQAWTAALGSGQPYNVYFRLKRWDGEYRWHIAKALPSFDSAGNILEWVGTNTDVGEREQDIRQIERMGTLLTESQSVAKLGSWELNVLTGELLWTDETYRLHDTSPEEFDPTVDAGVGCYLPESRDRLLKALDEAINHGLGYDLELEMLTTKGRRIDVRTTCLVTQKDGVSVRLVGTFQDISDQKDNQRSLLATNANLEKANVALKLSAHYDPLTELPNRTLLADRMQQAIVKCARQNQSVAIAFIDLDGFKLVNDTYGHTFGDEVLRKVAVQLTRALRQGDTLARIGGDEFVAVISDFDMDLDRDKVLNRMLESVSSTINVFGKVFKISASIGITSYPEDSVDPDQLLRHADQAMYIAKQRGKNCFHIFDIKQDFAVKHRQEELGHISMALSNKEFCLYYQPKVDLRTKQVLGFEALIRWNHPERGVLPPLMFLPVIEHDVLALDVGEWVIEEALNQLHEWWGTANVALPVSVNISALQLQDSNFTNRLAGLIEKSPDFKPNSLELEILESSALSDIDQVSQMIRDCKALGVTFSLDDFGTGYSSLTYLKRLPAEYLKIDQSFVRDMLSDPDDLAIIQGIIELAKAFDLKVIAEGVETPAHGEQLLNLGCYFAQGYGIARPMPANEVLSWLSDWQQHGQLTDSTKNC